MTETISNNKRRWAGGIVISYFLFMSIMGVNHFFLEKPAQAQQNARPMRVAEQISIDSIHKQGEVTASYNISPMTNPFVGTDAIAAYHWHNGYLANNAKRLEALSKKVKALEAEKE